MYYDTYEQVQEHTANAKTQICIYMQAHTNKQKRTTQEGKHTYNQQAEIKTT